MLIVACYWVLVAGSVIAIPEDAIADPEDVISEPEDVVAVTEDVIAVPKDAIADPKDAIADSEDAIADPEDAIADSEDVIADPEDAIADPEDAIADSEDVIADSEDVIACLWRNLYFYQSVRLSSLITIIMKNFLLLTLLFTSFHISDGRFKIPCIEFAGLTNNKSDKAVLNVETGKTYSTSFPLTESPISENGNWINGSDIGLDWGYVSTSAGQTHTHPGIAAYADATALLTGAWSPDQMAQATLGNIEKACMSDTCYPEVELRLRSTLAAHVCNGYEIAFSLKPDGKAYLIIVRWNGPLGDFTYLFNQKGSQYQAKSGDTVKATVRGNVISAYKNGILMGQSTDKIFTSGNPGMGFNERTYYGDYGFSGFTASDNP